MPEPLYLDTNLVDVYIRSGQAHLLPRMGFEIRITSTVAHELRNNFAFQEFQRNHPITIVPDSGVHLGQPNGGELSIQEAIRNDAANGITSHYAGDDARPSAVIHLDDGTEITRINSSELVRRGFNNGGISGPEAAQARDGLAGHGKLTQPADITSPGFQHWPTNEELGVKPIRDPAASKRSYIGAAEPTPHGYSTPQDDISRARLNPHLQEPINSNVTARQGIVNDPASYDPSGRMTPTAVTALESLEAAGRALGAAATLYDIGTTVTEVYHQWQLGNHEYAARELAALAGRNLFGWSAGILGFGVGASFGTAFGPWGQIAGGIIGAVIYGFFGVEVGDALGRELGDFINYVNGVLGGAFEGWSGWLAGLFGPLLVRLDPIVFDLNGDGVSLTHLDGSTAFFDLDGNGFAERTGWVSPSDGILARDLNANGSIDDITELFGSADQTGFEMLAALDSNADGLISSADNAFASLLVWRDVNQDGVSQSSELSTLSALGIASISLAAVDVHEPLQGNLITHRSSLTYTNGSQADAVAVELTSDVINTHYVVPVDFQYDPEVFALPNLRGYGRVPDLWVAMSLDPDLKQMVKDLVARGATLDSFGEIIGDVLALGFSSMPVTGAPTLPGFVNDDFENMLYRWATVVPRPENYTFDAASYVDGSARGWTSGMSVGVNMVNETIAAFLDRSIPHFAVGDVRFYEAFKQFSTNLAVRFYAQVPELGSVTAFQALAEAMQTQPPANGESYSSAEVDGFIVLLDAALASAPSLSAEVTGLAEMRFDFGEDKLRGDPTAVVDQMFAGFLYDPDHPWSGYDGLYETNRYLAEAVSPAEELLRQRLRFLTNNTALDIEQEEHQRLTGTPGDDELLGDVGPSHKDLLIGGGGNDLLNGGSDDDTYIFAQGAGVDVVTDSAGENDEIAFQGVLYSALARFSFANGNREDLLISFQGRSESVTITGYFTDTGSATLERITFPDGLEISHQAVRDAVYASLATSGNDTLIAFVLSTTVVGYAGNDTLLGQSGNDTLDGGVGNDLLQGGVGDDTYRFTLGSGHDIVRDAISGWNSGGIDTIALGAGITTADVHVMQGDAGSDLILSITATDQITLDGTLADAGYRIERVLFADGSSWSHADLMALATAPTNGNDLFYGGYDADTLRGGAGSDTLIGNSGTDTLIGGSGSDLLQGGLGSDTYVFNPGDGQDIIRDSISGWNSGGFDTVELGEGIAPTSVTVAQGNSGADLILTIGATDKITLGFTVNESGARIERVRFADGTIWDHSALMALATTPTAGNDTFYGGYDAETLSGAAGNDTLIANTGNDTLVGGTGNDLLQGGEGDDVYRFAAGDGQDIIRDAISGWNSGGNDRIELAAGIAPADVIVSQTDGGNDLVLKIGATDQITLDGAIADSSYRIEEVRFADGTAWTHDLLLQKSSGGTSGADILSGDSGANVLSGGAGNDTLRGNDGNDTLIGGTGNDLLQGGLGNDTYSFAAGDGQDIVRDAISGWNSGGSDTLQFESGISPTNVTVLQTDSGNDFILKIGATDQVTLDQGSSESAARIEQVRFVDGNVIWAFSDLLAKATTPTAGDDTFYGSYEAETLSGAGGNDRLVGNDGNDSLVGGAGNDVLQGGLGNDTYVFAAGDGQDIIRDAISGWNSGGTDTLEFAAGITPGSVTVVQSDGGNDFILKIGATDQVTLDQSVGDSTYRIEQVRFVDGNIVWTHADLLAKATTPTAGDDTFYGGYEAETLNGGAGNDRLVGNDGGDRLIGGTGNDVLQGGLGNDTYVFAAGDGQDIVRDAISGWNTGGSDIVQFSAGISAATVLVYQADNGNDFVLKIGATDQVTLDQAVTDGNSRIEEVRFVEGNVVWTYADLLTRAWSAKSTGDTYWGDASANSISGGEGTDTLWGRAGDDTLNGDAGEDTLNGEDGLDQLYGGDGNDTLTGGNGNDALYGGSDIDSLTGGAGNDTLDGGAGADNAKFAGLKSSYSLMTSGGSTQIVDNAPSVDGNDGTDQIVGVETLIFKNGETISLAAPIVLDLDGDGLELVDLGKTRASFDWNGDGLRDSTGWIGKGDGLLIYDRDGDGRVSGARELSFLSDAPGARSDLEGLRAFDSNGDGSFSALDAEWLNFHVWKDKDGDGSVDKGELLSMRKAGVASISLAATPTERSWDWGENPVISHTSFTRTNGGTGAVGDVTLTYSATSLDAAAFGEPLESWRGDHGAHGSYFNLMQVDLLPLLSLDSSGIA